MVLLARELFDTNGFIQRDLVPRYSNINLGSSTQKFKKIYVEEFQPDSIIFGSTDAGLVAYNTTDQTTNYEKFVADWASNVYQLGVSKGGSGTLRKLEIGVLGSSTKSTLIFDNTTTNGPKLAFGVGASSSLVDAASSGTSVFLKIAPYVNQSGTAGYTALLVDATENANGSGDQKLLSLALGGTQVFGVLSSGATTIAAGGLTVTAGGVTITAGGLTVTAGGATITAGDLTVTAGNMIFAAASAKVIPGATSLLFRDHADSNTNLSISDAGALVTRASLTVTSGGLTVTSGALLVSSGAITATVGDITATNGNVILSTAGKGLKIKEGSNATMGTATLNGSGTVTVSTTAVKTASRIWLTGVGTTDAGFLTIGTIVDSTSFVINSSGGSDARTVHWVIINPAS